MLTMTEEMKKAPDFVEFIGHLCKRPGMYTGGGSLKETLAFINGYRFGNATPISGRLFDRFVCIRNSFPSNYAWSYVIQACAKDDNEAHRMIEEAIREFVELKERLSEEEMMEFAVNQVPEETEAEKAFREFDRALLKGKEDLIKPLISAHKDASVLWQGAYPDAAAIALELIAAEQPVKAIPITEHNVRIIASGWPFPIEMNFTDGRWIVDAENIIELRKSSIKT